MTLVIVSAAAIGWTTVPMRKSIAVGVLVIGVVITPFLIPVVLAVAACWLAVRRLRTVRRTAKEDLEDLATLCDLVAIGTTGGLGIRSAFAVAGQHVGPRLASEADTVMRQARVSGTTSALLAANGIGERLYRMVGQAVASGQPLAAAATRLADDINAELSTQRLEAVRRLPIALLFPLTLLILPGFLLLTIAPSVIDAFVQLDF